MRMYAKRSGCVIFGLTFALLGAPAAHSDNASFVAGARAIGMREPDSTLIRMALSACRMLQPNLRRDPQEVVEHIVRYANLNPASIPGPGRAPDPTADPYEFLALSVNEYCPDLAYRVPAEQ